VVDVWRYDHVHEYLTFCRRAFAETAAGRRIQLSWAGCPLDREGWRRSFRKALDQRINLKAGPEPCWRKLNPAYQIDLMRDCRAIRDHATTRLAVHQIMTPELRRRFGHIISEYR
jgi:hypothetical protein